MFKIIASCITGLITGYMYGLFFVYERKRVLFNSQSMMHTFMLPIVMRILLFGVLIYYLLITTRIHFILTLLSFIAGFWSLILQQKAISYGRF